MEDPAPIEEQTWQEACGHDRKVIQLLQDGYSRFSRMTIAALVVLAVLLCVSLWRDYVLSNQNTQRIHDIQAARFDDAVNSCESSDQRNRGTIDQLNSLIANAVAKASSKAQQDQIRASEASTILLINALAPYHASCTSFARSELSGDTQK